MKSVAVVGNLAAGDPPYDDPNIDIWAFNCGAMNKPRIDAAFQMHQQSEYESLGEEYLGWLASCTIPVFMREESAKFPTAQEYPFDRIFQLTRHIKLREKEIRFFTSSPALAIALAVLQGRPSISIYGIEMMDNKEYRNQRECFAFWVGFAGGRGIPVDLYCAGSIFSKPIYGE